jgi:hypothetical protein
LSSCAERLGWIQSAEDWLLMRKLRNQIVMQAQKILAKT